MVIRYFFIIFLALLLQGCAESLVQGFIYQHTTTPLTTNFRETPSGNKTAAAATKHLDIQIEATWDFNGIGYVARKNHFTEVYYADLEIFSLFGIWQQQWVHIYGK